MADPKISFPHFLFALTTIRLLKLAAKYCLLLHIDSTYKLLWLDNLVHIAGIGDFNNRFHPFILCVCTKEEAEDNEFLCYSLQNGISLIGK